MSTLHILVDMDIIVFRSSLIGETSTNWGEGVVTIELNIEKSNSYMDSTVKSIVSKVLKHMNPKEYDVICCLSDKTNFRKQIYDQYKANRTKPKPQLYPQVRKYAEENYSCICWKNLEADDQISILATSLESCVICSIDKDFLTTPCTTIFSFDKEEFIETTKESAMYSFYYQCLLGDSVDNVPGAKGIGKVKAAKALAEECSWEQVVRIYESKGQTEENALLNARLVRILHASDWDAELQQPILWQPPSNYENNGHNACQGEVL